MVTMLVGSLLVAEVSGAVTTNRYWGPTVPAGGYYPECAYGVSHAVGGASNQGRSNAYARYSNGGYCNISFARPAGHLYARNRIVVYTGSDFVYCTDESSVNSGYTASWNEYTYCSGFSPSALFRNDANLRQLAGGVWRFSTTFYDYY